MKVGYQYITKEYFYDMHQNVPMSMVYRMIDTPSLYHILFTYLKLRGHYAFNGGNILRKDISRIEQIIGRKRRATFEHLRRLVELGYVRKTDNGWQLVSIYLTDSEIKASLSAPLTKIKNKDIREWTLAEFKSHISWVVSINWSHKKHHKEFLEDNNIAYIHEGRYYDKEHNKISKKQCITKSSTYLNGRNLSLRLAGKLINAHKSTARRRIEDSHKKEKRYVTPERIFVTKNKTCTIFDQLVHLNDTHQKHLSSKWQKRGINGMMGKYVIGANCKIYFQPCTRLNYESEVIKVERIKKRKPREVSGNEFINATENSTYKFSTEIPY